MSSRFLVSAMPRASVTCNDQLFPNSVIMFVSGTEQRLKIGIFPHRVAGFSRRAEGHDGRMLEGVSS